MQGTFLRMRLASAFTSNSRLPLPKNFLLLTSSVSSAATFVTCAALSLSQHISVASSGKILRGRREGIHPARVSILTSVTIFFCGLESDISEEVVAGAQLKRLVKTQDKKERKAMRLPGVQGKFVEVLVGFGSGAYSDIQAKFYVPETNFNVFFSPDQLAEIEDRLAIDLAHVVSMGKVVDFPLIFSLLAVTDAFCHTLY